MSSGSRSGRLGVVTLLLVPGILGAIPRSVVAQVADSAGIDHARLVADVGQLSDFIELTHPEPYGHDGMLAYQRRLHEVLRQLPENGMSRQRFRTHLESFVAFLGDGHTTIVQEDGGEHLEGPGLPLDLRILARDDGQPVPGLFVQAVAGEATGYAGARLDQVAGVPVTELIERERSIEGYDNEFDNLRRLVWRLWSRQGLRDLLPEWTGGDSISISLRSRDRREVARMLPLGPTPRTWDGEGARTQVELPATRVGVPAFRFLADDRKVALLRLDNTWAHREIFESLVKVGQGNLPWAQSFYQAYYDRPPPAETAELVAALPSAQDIFESLVTEMREARTQTLIVDVRRNSGGSSVLVNMLLYYLYGREGWRQFFGNMYTISRLTPDDVGNSDSTATRRFPERVGDYDFSGAFEAADRTASEDGNEEYLRRITIRFEKELETSEHEGVYVPRRVVVVIAPRTFSGGFWVAAALKRMGAELVGVPSGQAGNAFAHVKRTTLTNSGITVQVSSRMFVLFPEEPGSLSVLPLSDADLLTYETWEATGFDPNAAILLALGRAGESGADFSSDGLH